MAKQSAQAQVTRQDAGRRPSDGDAGRQQRTCEPVPTSMQKLLSDRINHYCTQLQMSYYELSYRSTVPLTTLMHIMKGSTRNPGIFTMIRICNGLGITVSEFFQAEEFANIEFDA